MSRHCLLFFSPCRTDLALLASHDGGRPRSACLPTYLPYLSLPTDRSALGVSGTGDLPTYMRNLSLPYLCSLLAWEDGKMALAGVLCSFFLFFFLPSSSRMPLRLPRGETMTPTCLGWPSLGRLAYSGLGLQWLLMRV